MSPMARTLGASLALTALLALPVLVHAAPPHQDDDELEALVAAERAEADLLQACLLQAQRWRCDGHKTVDGRVRRLEQPSPLVATQEILPVFVLAKSLSFLLCLVRAFRRELHYDRRGGWR